MIEDGDANGEIVDWDQEFGPLHLREKPKPTRLANQDGFVIPEDPTREQLRAAADWVRVRGGDVPVVDDRGLLVVSHYVTPNGERNGDRYYEFIQGPSVIVFRPDCHEFSAVSNYALDDYEIERFTL